jgi:16S rRNA (cytosine1402-N4)-methyltransferase
MTPDLKSSDSFHDPVMVDEAIAYLVTDPEGVYVDGTLGGGGHAEAIASKLSGRGRLFGFDRDDEAVGHAGKRLAGFGERVRVFQAAWPEIPNRLHELNVESIDGFLLDLGVSSHQINAAERGFSYSLDGELDMRMDRRIPLTALDIVSSYPETRLADLFWNYGEERNSRRIARLIAAEREKRPIRTTGELTRVVQRAAQGRPVKTLSRVFQALRLETNDELGQLRSGLAALSSLLKQNGVAVVIAYHSIEDRIVKHFFRGDQPETGEAVPERGTFRILTKHVVKPERRETAANPRSRSARIRAAQKTSA